MCLAPHIASLTVPVKVFSAAKAEERVRPDATVTVSKANPNFCKRDLISTSPFESMANSARPFCGQCLSGIKMRELLRGYRSSKKTGTRWHASPRMPGSCLGEGPGKTRWLNELPNVRPRTQNTKEKLSLFRKANKRVSCSQRGSLSGSLCRINQIDINGFLPDICRYMRR